MTRFSPSVQRVLDALNQGADCQREIQEMTGLCKGTVHWALRRLLACGVVRKTGHYRKIGVGGNGGKMACYEPKAWAEAAE